MDFVVNALEDIGIAGQVLLFYLLLRGPFRRYYLIFVYLVVEMLVTGADKYAIDSMGRQSPQFRAMYYETEMLVDLLAFVVVILFTYQVMEESPLRSKVRKMLAAIAGVAILIPFFLFSSPLLSGPWLNSTIQLFNFGATMMTLVLWTALIARKTRDPQMLMVCAGLGIAVAGNAALWGMRKFTPPNSDSRAMANMLIQLMYLVRLGIWCWAFRPQRPKPPVVSAKSFAS